MKASREPLWTEGEPVGPVGDQPRGGIRRRGRRAAGDQLDCSQVWRALEKQSFAVLGYVTPTGEPRSSGVSYKAVDRRLFVPVLDATQAHDIARSGRVAVVVPVRRDGFLALFYPIPPATIDFRAEAIVHEMGSPELASILDELSPLLAAERRRTDAVVEVRPDREFVTYGLAVSGDELRRPATVTEAGVS